MRRDLFTAEQEDFRLLIREFTEREIVPRYAEWEQAGEVPRSFFRKLGELGVMGWPSRKSTAARVTPTTSTT